MKDNFFLLTISFLCFAQTLDVYVFDDEETDDSTYLGLAQVPLSPLAQGKIINGHFQLTNVSETSGNHCIKKNLHLIVVDDNEFCCPFLCRFQMLLLDMLK